jgi:hypothetical protein
MRSVLPWFVAALLASSGCGSGSNIDPVPAKDTNPNPRPLPQSLRDLHVNPKLTPPPAPSSDAAIPVAPMPREVVR